MRKINKRAVFFERLTKNGRGPSNYPTDSAGIPLRITQYIPMKLREITPDYLKKKEKNQGKNDVVCLPEMMTLFDCLSKNEYDKRLCIQQAKSLQNCYSAYMEMKKK